MPGPAKTIQFVSDGEPRMTKQHSWTCVPHDRFHLGPLRGLVTVDRAIGAGRFFVSVRALLKPTLRIVQETAAEGA